MKKLYLLALVVLAEQPALANEHTSPATDQRTVVLGQSGTEAPNPAPEEKAKKGAQALFEESLRQRCRRIRNRFRNTRERSDQRERALLPVSPALNTRTVSVSLEPGRPPVPVFTTANVATSLVFQGRITARISLTYMQPLLCPKRTLTSHSSCFIHAPCSCTARNRGIDENVKFA